MKIQKIIRIQKIISLSQHYNAGNSFLSTNGLKIYQLKVKDSEIKSYSLCLGIISKGFTVVNMKKEWKVL